MLYHLVSEFAFLELCVMLEKAGAWGERRCVTHPHRLRAELPLKREPGEERRCVMPSSPARGGSFLHGRKPGGYSGKRLVAFHRFIDCAIDERVHAFAGTHDVFLHLIFFALWRAHFELVIVFLHVFCYCLLLCL